MFRPTGRWYREEHRYRGRGRSRHNRRDRRRPGLSRWLRRILAVFLISRIIRMIMRKDRQRYEYD